MQIILLLILTILFKIDLSLCVLNKPLNKTVNSSYSSYRKFAAAGDVPEYNYGLRVAGGKATDIREFPHNVIFINDGGVCGGSIMSDKIVLTAAHCLDHNVDPDEMEVFAGSRYLFDHAADIHTVWFFLIHDRYNQPIRFANDAALLIIQDKFRFKDTIKRAFLVNNEIWMTNRSLFKVSGWGETVHDQEKVSEQGLQSAELQFLPLSDCEQKAGTPLSPDMFCLTGDGGKGTCRGDSGGGVLWNNMVVGIVSHGAPCGLYPGVYTNVFYLLPWIESTSKKLYVKFCRFFKAEDHIDN